MISSRLWSPFLLLSKLLVDMKEISDIFDGVQEEEDDSETLNKEKFVVAMVGTGHQAFRDPQVARSFFDALDANGNGSVDKKELLTGLLALMSDSLETKLKSFIFLCKPYYYYYLVCFRIYDLNKDHSIEPAELKHMLLLLSKLGNEDESLSENELNELADKIYRDFDSDGNNVITVGRLSLFIITIILYSKMNLSLLQSKMIKFSVVSRSAT
jgi:Ca2+-binding EF-hand superfamily protein